MGLKKREKWQDWNHHSVFLGVFFAFKHVVVEIPLDIKSFPTLCLCFALPVIVFCHKLEGLRAAVCVYATA